MPEALMHLGSMAVLMGIVYLNLDKVSSIRNAFVDDLIELQAEIKKRFTRADVEIWYSEGKKEIITSVYANRKAHFLLCVGCLEQRNKYSRWMRFWYWWHRNIFKAPGLPIIRDGWHSWPVGVLTILSALCLFNIAATAIFKPFWILPLNIPWAILYWLFVSTILSAVAFAFIAHRLDGLRATCMLYLNEMDTKKAHEDDSALRTKRYELGTFVETIARRESGLDPDRVSRR